MAAKHIHIHVGVKKTVDAGNFASLKTRVNQLLNQAEAFEKKMDDPNRNRALDRIADEIQNYIG